MLFGEDGAYTEGKRVAMNKTNKSGKVNEKKCGLRRKTIDVISEDGGPSMKKSNVVMEELMTGMIK